jgi:hypothetical protein
VLGGWGSPRASARRGITARASFTRPESRPTLRRAEATPLLAKPLHRHFNAPSPTVQRDLDRCSQAVDPPCARPEVALRYTQTQLALPPVAGRGNEQWSSFQNCSLRPGRVCRRLGYLAGLAIVRSAATAQHAAASQPARSAESLGMSNVRLIMHEVSPRCGSFEVRYLDGRPSTYFYWDDLPSRLLRPDLVDGATALEPAKALARAERDRNPGHMTDR